MHGPQSLPSNQDPSVFADAEGTAGNVSGKKLPKHKAVVKLVLVTPVTVIQFSTGESCSGCLFLHCKWNAWTVE